MKKSFYLLLLLLSGLLLNANAQIKVYVTEAGAGAKNGTSWATAYDNTQLQTAIDQAASLATVASPVQVWVAKGAYRPVYVGGGNFFKMYNNVAIYGGFAGGEITLTQRNFKTNVSRLDEQDPGTGTIFKNQNINASAILDGFSFIPEPFVPETGGKIQNTDGPLGTKPTIRNCKLYHVSNQAKNGYECSPTYINCEINQSDYNSGLLFGNSANGTSSKNNTQYINCLFTENSTKRGFANDAMNNGQTNVGYINCTIFQNYTGVSGAYVSITTDGTGSAKATLRNCIVWGNEDKISNPAQIYTSGTGASVDVQYSDVEGGYAGTGNINTDPLFVNQYYANLRLRNPCSPCINTGKSSFNLQSIDFDGLTRVVGGQIDMGAYENPLPSFTSSILYVTTTGAGDKSGTSWANASDDLQVMIDLGTCVAAKSGSVVQVWVAKGIYKAKPHAGYYHLNNKVEVYGGFVGNETLLNQRNFKTNVCQLSSNYGTSVTMENIGVDATAVLDGFLFAPNLNDPNVHVGSRVYNYDSGLSDCKPIFRNCSFANQISAGGVLVYNTASAGHECSPMFINCVFRDNTGIATFQTGATGVGSKANVTYINCSFTNNVFLNSTMGNQAEIGGSAISTFINCTIFGNQATYMGNAGGIYNYSDGMAGSVAKIVLRNSIVWGNKDKDGNLYQIKNEGTGATIDAQYADIQGGGFAGTGNINADPKFVNAATFDVHLSCNSPCLNTGLNAANPIVTDLDGQSRLFGTTIDMGAYEYQDVKIEQLMATATTTTPMVCVGNSILLNANGGNRFLWNGPNGSMFQSTSQSPQPIASSLIFDGLYTVTVSNANCPVTASATVSVQIKPIPTIQVAFAPICAVGNPLNLTARGGDLYAWKGPNGFKSNSATPTKVKTVQADEGTYSVTVTGNTGCAATSTIRVYFGIGKVTVSSNSPVCKGGTIKLTAIAEYAATSYKWTKQLGSTVYTGQNPTIPNAKTSDGGLYTVFVTGQNGCIAKGGVIVTVSPIPCVGGRLASEETTEDVIQVTVMPNPTNGDLRVEVKLSEPSAVEFSLLDANGNPKLLGNSVEDTDRHQWQADLTQWADGLYLLRTQTPTSQKITKIWKLSK